MKSVGPMVCHHSDLILPDSRVHFAHYSGSSSGPRKLLLIHGAGVAGDLTWRFVINYLQGWDEIVVPDLPGMGVSDFVSSDAPALEDYLVALRGLLDHLAWSDFSIAGYSFGGLLAMHLSAEYSLRSLALVEPAALLSTDIQRLLCRGEEYLRLGNAIRHEPDNRRHYLEFLDIVSPARVADARQDALAVERMMARGSALADGVATVGSALLSGAERYAGWVAPARGCSLVGELSVAEMHERHEQLARLSSDWSFHSVSGGDHGLIYTRPRQVAQILNERL